MTRCTDRSARHSTHAVFPAAAARVEQVTAEPSRGLARVPARRRLRTARAERADNLASSPLQARVLTVGKLSVYTDRS